MAEQIAQSVRTGFLLDKTKWGDVHVLQTVIQLMISGRG